MVVTASTRAARGCKFRASGKHGKFQGVEKVKGFGLSEYTASEPLKRRRKFLTQVKSVVSLKGLHGINLRRDFSREELGLDSLS